MIQYTIAQVAEIIGAEVVLGAENTTVVNQILMDSRKVLTPETSLFFAIKGERHDGHAFVGELLKKGVRNFILSQPDEKLYASEANFILVKDTLHAVQQLAAFHRRQFAIPVIGITGSNGKTIIKEWLYQLMRQDKNIVRSPKSYNSQIGVPLSVWQLAEEHELALFEAGLSQPGEMIKLETIIQPNIGIFTNVGDAHAENFTSLHQKVFEKLKLFTEARVLIYCKDYLTINEEINKADFLRNDIELFTWSRKTSSTLQIGRIAKAHFETEIQGIYKNDFIKIKIPFTDDASIENAIHCWALMLCLEYGNEVIAERMEQLSPVAMRLELKEGINNCSIINDSYNSDLGSLTIALDFLNHQKQHNKRTLVLSDILQSGKNEAQLYKEVAHLIEQKQVSRLIGIGEAIYRQKDLFAVQKEFYATTDDFLKQYDASMFKDETVLLKGARAFGFERISTILQQKAHETVLEINLNALIHNLNYYRSGLNPGTKIMAMVKAFSYGSGGFEIANILQFHRVDYLAVAYADEGVELRKAGISLPIMVMSPEEYSFESMIQYKLEPEIYSFRVLHLYAEAVKQNAQYPTLNNFPVHIKLDTGMHRLGFDEADINELIIRIQNHKFLSVKSIFTHLAGTDEPEHDNFTTLQVTNFIRMRDKISTHFNYHILSHALNSAGILRFPQAQFDMVRLGIGLYGIAPDEQEQRQLECIGTLKTTITQIKNIPAGETIGYSRKGVAKRAIQTATVAIGYADGLSRKLSNGVGRMWVNGYPAPIVGNVCMDMCMIDITDISAKEGDEVIVFGPAYPITKIAKDIGTIPYEVLTNISQRVKRVYFQE